MKDANDYKVDNGGHAVTPPTNKDIYETAANEVVDWSGERDLTPDATDHLSYHKNPTTPPKQYDDNGVTPPTNHDIYDVASKAVAQSAEVDLDDSAVMAQDAEAADKKLEQ